MSYPIFDLFTSDSGAEFIMRVDSDDTVTFIPVNESNSDYLAYLVEQETA